MPIKPFTWSNLKKVTGEEVRLVDALFELLPATSARDKLGTEVRKMLLKHLGEKSFYYLDNISTGPYGEFLTKLPDTPILAVISMEPKGQKAILQIDANLSALIIDRLLGGGGVSGGEVGARPLSETESGILQYFIMQVLALVWRVCGGESRFHFRFERFCSSAREIEDLAPNKNTTALLSFKIGIGELSGFAKLLFLSVPAKTKNPFELPYFVNRVSHYDYIRTTLWAEGGRASVPHSELADLEAGDVLLFDETGLVNTSPAGEVFLHVGNGEEGSLRAKIQTGGKTIKCIIVGG